MHEIEGAVDGVVLVLDESPLSAALDMRSIYDSLARFVGRWDASFQHFHVLASLVKHRYTYAFPVTEHPEYERHKAYFDGLREQEFQLRHPNREAWQAGHTESGMPQDGYSAQAVMANPHFQAIRGLIIETRAYEYNNDYGLTRLPAEEEFQTGFEMLDDGVAEQGWGQFLDWWYEPLKNSYADKRNQA
ncbi:hypothetical protein SAMN04487970_102548 [Paenibacillus tianmuensis]|uniref:Uncharacterized protein n=1 Tax=Paenibacillus tianmuensis TaxID=624147 RepID=A0A1G4SBB8_9BACL|nr:hypothetical protein [Paenibacillus tianmuensis]SCW65855.1 hypothetical protein SAMN04487970_102548 [Paenibacillus tianmuensis]